MVGRLTVPLQEGENLSASLQSQFRGLLSLQFRRATLGLREGPHNQISFSQSLISAMWLQISIDSFPIPRKALVSLRRDATHSSRKVSRNSVQLIDTEAVASTPPAARATEAFTTSRLASLDRILYSFSQTRLGCLYVATLRLQIDIIKVFGPIPVSTRLVQISGVDFGGTIFTRVNQCSFTNSGERSPSATSV